ncbi:MAG: zinc-binding alcohol dehydrogenase family protein [Bryobacteraceae bacterium]
MRQIVLTAPGHFSERHVSRPNTSPGEALVRIRKIGVCGSDFHAYAGKHPVYTFPRVLGHEISGEVVDVDHNGAGLAPGDHCAIEPYMSCGACRACRARRPNCCENLRLLGVHVDGGMQGFLSVPLQLLHKSDQLSLDQLALVETLGIGAHAVERSGLSEGEEVLVVGVGPIGLAVVQFAAAAGGVVRILEKSAARREFAQQFVKDTLEQPDERLADVVFDATGSATAMEASVHLVAPAGRLVFVGICRDSICIDDSLFHKREMTLYASRNSSYQFPRIIRMIEAGNIDTARWINARLPLRDVPRVFPDLPNRPNLVKAIVEVDDSDL